MELIEVVGVCRCVGGIQQLTELEVDLDFDEFRNENSEMKQSNL